MADQITLTESQFNELFGTIAAFAYNRNGLVQEIPENDNGESVRVYELPGDSERFIAATFSRDSYGEKTLDGLKIVRKTTKTVETFE